MGAAFGLAGSRYVFVGSALSLIPWGLVALLIGYLSRSLRRAVVDGAAYGFALAFAFMCFGYQGPDPLTTEIVPFTVLGLVGALCALLLTVAGQQKSARRRC